MGYLRWPADGFILETAIKEWETGLVLDDRAREALQVCATMDDVQEFIAKAQCKLDISYEFGVDVKEDRTKAEC